MEQLWQVIVTVWQGKLKADTSKVELYTLFQVVLRPVPIHCLSFPTRLGETCSHVGTVLFKLEASVSLGYNKVECTDLACQWNKVCTQKVKPGLIKDIEFYSQSAKAKTPAKRCKYKGPVPPATKAQQIQLLEILSFTCDSSTSQPSPAAAVSGHE